MSDTVFTVLSPWAHVNQPEKSVFAPRCTNLEGKTVGLWANFKGQTPIYLRELEKMLSKKFPNTKFKHFQYLKDTAEARLYPDDDKELKEWLKDVDTVISGPGDAGSCAMYIAHNMAYVESLGIPTMIIVTSGLTTSAQTGYETRFVTNPRIVEIHATDTTMWEKTEEVINKYIAPPLAEKLDDIIEAVTAPMKDSEEPKPFPEQTYANATYKGTFNELNSLFYKNGWTNGTPMCLPTEEAVEEMLQGTDLPRDHVVCELPPRNGQATVEKIAINAVMAGCLPTYLPAVIAAAESMVKDVLEVVGWTCSIRSWFGPHICINGPVRDQIHMAKDNNFMSMYTKPSQAISRAVAYMITNIAGVRSRLQDRATLGDGTRQGVCFAEDEEESPWEPHSVDFGYEKGDNVVSIFWPVQKLKNISCVAQNDANMILDNMIHVEDIGFGPGCMYVLTPPAAKTLAEAGYSKRDVINYVVEYARRDLSYSMRNWMTANNHQLKHCPANIPLPVDDKTSTRVFWDDRHVCIIVGGSHTMSAGASYIGGGDHGGPTAAKMQLPKNWDKLVEKYKDEFPEYIPY